MLTYGLLGAIAIRSASASASSTPGAGRAASAPSKRTPSTSSRWRRADEPLLERKLAGRRGEPGAEPLVGGRQQRRLEAEGERQPGRDRRERLAAAQRLRADEVQPEVAVAEPEPRLAAELADGLERVPGLVGAAPALRLVEPPGEGVEDRVEVG